MASAKARAEPPGARAWMVAGVLAAAWVVGIDLLTNSTPPLWDATSYVAMASEGIARNEHLVAPFAYRPGVPMLARTAATVLGTDVLVGFDVVTRILVFATLLLAWRLAHAAGARAGTAISVQAVAALAFFHAKLPLFFPTLVDVGAYPWVLGAVLALVSRRAMLASGLALVGLLFKEFALVPCGMIAWQLARERRLLASATVVGATAAVFFGVRALIQVERSQEFVDVSSLEGLWTFLWWVPLKWERDVNLLFSVASHGLPVWMLLTRERWNAWRAAEVRARAPFGVGIGLVLLLALYGGTNVSTFVSHASFAVTAVVAVFLARGAGRIETLVLLVGLCVFNRVLVELPVPVADARAEVSRAYLDVYAGWGTRLSAATLERALELGAWIAAAWIARRVERARVA